MGARKTEEEKAATLQVRRTRARLKRSRAALEAFLFRLESLHADKSGAFRMMYMHTPLLTDEAIPTHRSTAQTEREAGAGCVLCAEWLTETAEARTRMDYLRNTPLPEQEPGYNGPSPLLLFHRAHTVGKRREVNYVCAARRDVTEILAEREAHRRERRAALADLLGVVQDARGGHPWLET